MLLLLGESTSHLIAGAEPASHTLVHGSSALSELINPLTLVHTPTEVHHTWLLLLLLREALIHSLVATLVEAKELLLLLLLGWLLAHHRGELLVLELILMLLLLTASHLGGVWVELVGLLAIAEGDAVEGSEPVSWGVGVGLVHLVKILNIDILLDWLIGLPWLLLGRALEVGEAIVFILTRSGSRGLLEIIE